MSEGLVRYRPEIKLAGKVFQDSKSRFIAVDNYPKDGGLEVV